MLAQRVAHRVAAVVGRDHLQVVPGAGHAVARTQFLDGDGERRPLEAQLERVAKHPLRAFRPVQPQGTGEALEPQRAHQPREPQKVVAVEVGEEDVGHREPHAVPHHLPLRALPAVEQQRLALALERDGRHRPLHRGPRRRRAEKGEGEHGAK